MQAKKIKEIKKKHFTRSGKDYRWSPDIYWERIDGYIADESNMMQDVVETDIWRGVLHDWMREMEWCRLNFMCKRQLRERVDSFVTHRDYLIRQYIRKKDAQIDRRREEIKAIMWDGFNMDNLKQELKNFTLKRTIFERKKKREAIKRCNALRFMLGKLKWEIERQLPGLLQPVGTLRRMREIDFIDTTNTIYDAYKEARIDWTNFLIQLNE